MIGSGLKKLAAEHGMTVGGGMAYGVMGGYAVSMDEGAGWKRITIATKFPDPMQRGELVTLTNSRNLQKEFRVLQLDVADCAIIINFHDDPGTMKCITAFLDWFMPLLPRYGATGADRCPHCGMALSGSGGWKQIGAVVAPFHSTCAARLEQELNADLDGDELAQTGSYAAGFAGALIGGLLGAILWGALYNFGFISAIVGFVIGWLAEKGYTLLRGKKGSGKVVILVVVAILCVLLGTVLGYAFSLASGIASGELGAWSYGDIPYMLLTLLTDAEFLMDAAKDVLLGLLFAGLGIFSLLRKAGKEVSRVKIKDL